MNKESTKQKAKRKCICCKNEVELIAPDIDSPPESAMWNNGVVGKIYAGYGSRHDGDMYIITICDDCIDKHLNDSPVETRKCARCGCDFPSLFDSNICDDCIRDERAENEGMNDSCPACGRDYDEIDYEYQICSHCKHQQKP
jgi:hypothetical protein